MSIGEDKRNISNINGMGLGLGLRKIVRVW